MWGSFKWIKTTMSCGDAGDTRPRNWPWEIHMGLVMKIVYPKKPNGFADHYPVFKWLFHWGYTPFSDIPIYFIAIVFFFKLQLSNIIYSRFSIYICGLSLGRSERFLWDVRRSFGCSFWSPRLQDSDYRAAYADMTKSPTRSTSLHLELKRLKSLPIRSSNQI